MQSKANYVAKEEKLMITIYPIPGSYPKEEFEVSIIIPLYKSVKVIKDQIRRWIYEDISLEIIYVDDHCPHASYLAVMNAWKSRADKELFNVRILASEKNLGFGGACNLGAYHARGKKLIFLNADTTSTPYWITNLAKALDDSSVGIVGNLQIKEGGEWHGTIDSAGSEWFWKDKNFVHVGRHILDGKLIPKPIFPDELKLEKCEREMVTGCCFGINKKLFGRIGGFDQRYKIAYWEDSEICMTVKEMGYKVIFDPSSVIYHKLSHSGGIHDHHYDNKELFLNKWVNTGRIDGLVTTKRPLKPMKISNILIKRGGAHGDVLVAAAIAPALKKKYPEAKVYFDTECPSVLEGNPYIDGLVKEGDILAQYTCNLDLVYERRPFTNILEAYADEAGVSVNDCQLFLAQQPVNKPLFHDYVVIHAGKTNWVGRNWFEEGFRDLALRIHNAGNQIICVGNQNDYFVPSDSDVRGKTSINQLATIIKDAKLFVGIDSLPFHIAQAVKTPGVVFFGSIDPKSRILNSNIIPVTAKDLPCLGCHHKKLPPSTVTNECSNEREPLACEKMVNVEMMWQKIKGLL